MDDTQLRQTLTQLHAELKNAGSLDDGARQMLADLQGDIGQVLQRSREEEFGDVRGMLGRLEDSIERFEISHPKLTAAFNNVISTLNNLGI